MNDKIVIMADARHTQRWCERGTGPLPCAGDLDSFCDLSDHAGLLAALDTRAHTWSRATLTIRNLPRIVTRRSE